MYTAELLKTQQNWNDNKGAKFNNCIWAEPEERNGPVWNQRSNL